MGILREHGVALIGADAEHQRHLIAARAHAGKKRLADAVLSELNPAVGGIEFNGYAGNHARTQGGSAFVLITNATAVRTVFRAEAARQIHSSIFA